MGVFQIESPAMRGLLHAQKARTLEEMAAALALIRPGAAEYGSKELFLKRLRGKEPVVYAHPALEKILGDTLGVCIFQEQVMQIAQAIGDMSLAEADLVRRSAAKYSGAAGTRAAARKIPESGGANGIVRTRARRDLDDGGKIRGVWILQSARGDVRGHFLPHGVFEDASPGGISGGDVQRGRWVLPRVGIRGRGETLGDRSAAALGESFADGIHGGGDWRWKAGAARRADAGERAARGDDDGDCAGAGK